MANTEAENFRPVLRLLKELYGDMRASEFGPRALKTVRQRMLDAGNARTYVNQNVRRLRRVFKWAVAEELIEPSRYQALAAVDGLRAGRGAVREAEPRRRSSARGSGWTRHVSYWDTVRRRSPISTPSSTASTRSRL